MQLAIFLTFFIIISSSIITHFIASILIDYQVAIISVTIVIILGNVLARRNIFIIASFLLLWSFINLKEYKNYVIREEKEDWKSALALLHQKLTKNDILIFLPAYSEQSYRYFSKLYLLTPHLNITSVTENKLEKILMNIPVNIKICAVVSYDGYGASQNIMKYLQNKKNFNVTTFRGIKLHCSDSYQG